jgi:hypothetical protein
MLKWRNDGGAIELHGHSNRIFGQSNKYYKKNTEEEFRSYFFDILKENKLSSSKENSWRKVEITPEEVRNFSNQYKEICLFCAEMEWLK